MAPAAVPVIVGVGDFANRSTQIKISRDLASLMVDAINDALNDTKLAQSAVTALKSCIDSISVVNTWTWSYVDLPGRPGQKLGVEDLKHQRSKAHNDRSPIRLLDHATRKIA